MWPTDVDALIRRQCELGAARPTVPALPDDPRVGGCWVCFPRGCTGPGRAGDPAWTAAVVLGRDGPVEQRVLTGAAAAPYVPGLLALRQGLLLDTVVRGLARAPDLLLVDGTGRDHPRGAGLAIQLGAELEVPTVGVTHRPLLAHGEWPSDRSGATSPLHLGGEVVGCWLRTRAGARPLAVHPGWRVDLESAVDVVVRSSRVRRTPEPLRLARQAARTARSRAEAARAETATFLT